MRIGIIGAGWMGGVHSDSYTRIPGCRVVGVADIRPSAASSLAATWGARCYGDILSLLAAETPDLADICLPTYLHKDAVLACLERGVPVLCEKPIALSVADARAMCAASSRTRVPFFVAHVLRFFPEFTHMEKLLKDGLVGRPALVRGFRGGGFPKTGWENWYASPSASGGVLVDLLIHDLDFLLSTL
ncbi:MAG: Gfo/Idh/MocA family oxidoreductase, partial [Armatimonadetes bacterium]|nr:Gfo/Idh/MocA family oxidoreductase [Armatimonadota bacterium]